ncbi:hypothetical protein DEU56DRAFT_779314 [Suillus clintonianus]|uniref:uncharacterized protein n=1 Tax=Suillus clintonianus TaxID=1904413 RepID=UPI001B87172D|nr:uncharacterized protein DEU56DRAFT_779314 [Suillus clintonianus]KAG2150952.1 hypothetical protein DEU56DRAFT_779314 [Suillus clintonianus]
MRKTSYAATFAAVLIILVINILSARLPDWLIARYDIANAQVTVRYGLMERCERSTISFPGPSKGGHLEYTDYECRAFPLRVKDKCDGENRLFCALWTSAQYFTELGIGFAAMGLAALVIGVSTHSRRRRVWRAVAGLVILHAVFQLITFILVTELYRKDRFPAFEHAKPGVGYVLNAVSWVSGFAVGAGVIITGIAADRGHKWAAGNRAYRPIRGYGATP